MADKDLLIDFVEWDTTNWAKALAFWERSVDLENNNYSCLELGGRRGGLSLWLAIKGNNVICSDLKNPESEAGLIHQKYYSKSRITYQAIDATDIPYENFFDIVIFKSILGGISRDGNGHLNQVVVDQIFKALKPGGKLLFAENLKGSKLHRFLRKKLVRWGDSWNYLDVRQLPILLRNFEGIEYKTAGFLGTLGRSELQRNILGTIDTFTFDWLAENDLKYIVFGYCSKPASNIRN